MARGLLMFVAATTIGVVLGDLTVNGIENVPVTVAIGVGAGVFAWLLSLVVRPYDHRREQRVELDPPDGA